MPLTKTLILLLAVLPLAMPAIGLAGMGASGTDINGVQTGPTDNVDQRGTAKTDGTAGSVSGTMNGTSRSKKKQKGRRHRSNETTDINGVSIPVNSNANNADLPTPGTTRESGTIHTGAAGASNPGQK